MRKIIAGLIGAAAIVIAILGAAAPTGTADAAPAKPCTMVIPGGVAPCPPYAPATEGGDTGEDVGTGAAQPQEEARNWHRRW